MASIEIMIIAMTTAAMTTSTSWRVLVGAITASLVATGFATDAETERLLDHARNEPCSSAGAGAAHESTHAACGSRSS